MKATTEPTYVLITPARNEELHLEQTIQSVVGQTFRPAKWVIVSDGSTDRTDEIARRHAAAHEWIELVRMPERKERHFAGKVHAFNAGAARVHIFPTSSSAISTRTCRSSQTTSNTSWASSPNTRGSA